MLALQDQSLRGLLLLVRYVHRPERPMGEGAAQQSLDEEKLNGPRNLDLFVAGWYRIGQTYWIDGGCHRCQKTRCLGMNP